MRVLDGELVKDGIRQLELASLPTGLEWRAWWNEWSRHVEQKDGWERAIVDAVTRLVKNQLTLARQMRFEAEGKRMIRYNSDGYVYGEETRTPDEITREALVWFIANVKPRQADAPEWAGILFRGVEGCYLQQARLGLELAGMKKKGYLTVNHSATVRNPQSFTEAGSEIL